MEVVKRLLLFHTGEQVKKKHKQFLMWKLNENHSVWPHSLCINLCVPNAKQLKRGFFTWAFAKLLIKNTSPAEMCLHFIKFNYHSQGIVSSKQYNPSLQVKINCYSGASRPGKQILHTRVQTNSASISSGTCCSVTSNFIKTVNHL